MAVVKFHSTNAQNDGIRKLKRMAFEFDGKTYEFVMNPEEYTQSEPSRVSITQTKGGAWADDFGAGIPKITMKGTTGFKSRVLNDGQIKFLYGLINKGGGEATWAKQELDREMSGFSKFKELRDTIREYYGKYAPGTVINASKELIFHNYTDGEHWVVMPETFELFRSVSRPILYGYNISLWCLRPATEPNTPFNDLYPNLPPVVTVATPAQSTSTRLVIGTDVTAQAQSRQSNSLVIGTDVTAEAQAKAKQVIVMSPAPPASGPSGGLGRMSGLTQFIYDSIEELADYLAGRD